MSPFGLRASRKPSEMEPLRHGLIRAWVNRVPRRPRLSGAPALGLARGGVSAASGGDRERARGPGRGAAARCQCGGHRAARPEGPRTAPSDRGRRPSGAGLGAHPAGPVRGPGRGRGGHGRSWPGRAAGTWSRLAAPPPRRQFPVGASGRRGVGTRVRRRGGLETGWGDWTPRVRDAGASAPLSFSVAGAASGSSGFVSPPMLFWFLNPDALSLAPLIPISPQPAPSFTAQGGHFAPYADTEPSPRPDLSARPS